MIIIIISLFVNRYLLYHVVMAIKIEKWSWILEIFLYIFHTFITFTTWRMFADPSEHKIYGSVTVNAKWQIVIPSDARERLGIKPWDQLLVTSKWDIVIGLIKADNLQEFIAKVEQDSPGFFDSAKHCVGTLRQHIK